MSVIPTNFICFFRPLVLIGKHTGQETIRERVAHTSGRGAGNALQHRIDKQRRTYHDRLRAMVQRGTFPNRLRALPTAVPFYSRDRKGFIRYICRFSACAGDPAGFVIAGRTVGETPVESYVLFSGYRVRRDICWLALVLVCETFQRHRRHRHHKAHERLDRLRLASVSGTAKSCISSTDSIRVNVDRPDFLVIRNNLFRDFYTAADSWHR